MPAEPAASFVEFIQQAARELRAGDRVPPSLEAWNNQRDRLKRNLQQAWGPFPREAAPLEPRVIGVLERDGYKIERLIFQTWPGAWMTANAYVPKQGTKFPAVLNVHGHWPGAKQDPHVQARCVGLAKLGFLALAVDAFGAGERGVDTKLGEYHGDMTAGTLWPTGFALAGLQVYENMRAVDYLQSRPDVDGERIGITGASGGGNQTMYAGAWDERFKAIVPVCSVGNYQAYLGPACCMCEVIPAALRFTEEWAVLGLTAPRALMVVNATRDSRQFSVEEAKKSLTLTSGVYALHGRAERLRHATFESPHDYNQAMREAMYGWMTLHLKEQGDGSPIPEQPQTLDDPESLRCFPGDSRPAEYLTIPRFAARAAKPLVEQRLLPDHREYWESESYLMREGLERVSGPQPEECPLNLQITDLAETPGRDLKFDVEPNWRGWARHLAADSKRWAILVDAEGLEAATTSELAKELVAGGWNVVVPQLRGVNSAANKTPSRRSVDHNEAEWSLWLGRPLAAQWAWDLRRTLDALLASIDSQPEAVALIGSGPACVATALAAAQDDSFLQVALVKPLVSYVSDVPYQGQRMASLVPGMLVHVGDLPQCFSLIAPRRLLIAGGVTGSGETLDAPQLERQLTYPRHIYALLREKHQFEMSVELTPKQIVEKLLG